MDNAPTLILAVIGMLAIGGFLMLFSDNPSAGEVYYQYQSPAQKCISTCEERFIFGTEVYDACIQDCLPPNE